MTRKIIRRFSVIFTCINYHINEIHTFGESIAQIDMMERYDASFTLCTIQCFATLESFFTTHLILIKLGEIINNDRNGQCDYQHAANATHWANNFPKRCRGTYVTILIWLIEVLFEIKSKLDFFLVRFMYRILRGCERAKFDFGRGLWTWTFVT